MRPTALFAFIRVHSWLTAVLGSVAALIAVPASGAESKCVMAYYMPWYVAKPFSTNWGWHWTMNHFDPDTITVTGQRHIASWYYPLIGPYDSADPAVLEYHVLLMKLAGIDGVIVDWYGPDSYLDYASNNARTSALFRFTRKAGLKFSLCYEDHTILQEVNGGFLASTNALAHAKQTMLYLQTNYFTDPTFLRWNHRPVLLNFGPQYFKTNSDWQAIFSVLDLTNQPAFFTEDNRLSAGAGAFNWPPMWLSQAPGTGGVLSSVALQNYLAVFEHNGASWPAFISSAFPRFHDIYQKAGVRDYWGYLGDRNGDTLRETLGRALTNSAPILQLVTWNDFGEGTIVEPTQEYGYRDLGVVQDFRRKFLQPEFPYHTNDLVLVERLYHLRQQRTGAEGMDAELDTVFSRIVAGDLAGAAAQLDRLEARPVGSAAQSADRPASASRD